MVDIVKAGTFNPTAWTAAEETTNARDFDQALAAIAAQSEASAPMLVGMFDADLWSEMEFLGARGTRGAVLVNLVLSSCAAYRTQLFLTACGREELSTMHLWGGKDS